MGSREATSAPTVTVAARVAQGVALLDAQRPGWWREVDVGRLDMGDCFDCVLGQLFGDYEAGMLELSLSFDDSPLGFDGLPSEDGSVPDGERYDLTEEWARIITARQGAQP